MAYLLTAGWCGGCADVQADRAPGPSCALEYLCSIRAGAGPDPRDAAAGLYPAASTPAAACGAGPGALGGDAAAFAELRRATGRHQPGNQRQRADLSLSAAGKAPQTSAPPPAADQR